MLELNDVVLEAVSGGSSRFSRNKNYANIKLSHVRVDDDSTLLIVVTQSIG